MNLIWKERWNESNSKIFWRCYNIEKGMGVKVMDMWKQFYEEENGMGTVEIVMIIAALMCVALLFRDRVVLFAGDVMDKIFKTDPIELPSSAG